MNLPNKLTVGRIVLTFAFVALLSFENLWCLTAGLIVFIVASITDYYDGRIARSRGLVTNFGKLADPVADKILVSAAFIMLMLLDPLCIPGWCVIAILGREFLITGARGLAASEGVVIAANIWGKIKAVLQMAFVYVFLGLTILVYALLNTYTDAGIVMAMITHHASLWASIIVALFTIYSGVQFVIINWKALHLDNL